MAYRRLRPHFPRATSWQRCPCPPFRGQDARLRGDCRARTARQARATHSASLPATFAEDVCGATSGFPRGGARWLRHPRSARPQSEDRHIRGSWHGQRSQLVARGSRGRRRRWAKCEKKNIFPVPPSLSLPPFKSNEDPYQYLRLLRCCYHLATSLQNCQMSSPEEPLNQVLVDLPASLFASN